MVTPKSKSSDTESSPWIPVWLSAPVTESSESRLSVAPSPVDSVLLPASVPFVEALADGTK